jgi:hypothetical protein
MTPRAKKPKRPSRPRVPLPRQVGGRHADKRLVLPRKQKHKVDPGRED